MKKLPQILALNMVFAGQIGAEPPSYANAKVLKQNAEGRAQVANGFWSYIDIDLLDPKTGEATVVFIKSISPVHCSVLQSRGIAANSTQWKDIQTAIPHISVHGVNLNRVPQIIEDAQKAWLQSRKPEGFDPKPMQEQKKKIIWLINTMEQNKKRHESPQP